MVGSQFISVIIPSFGNISYLLETIGSLVQQTYKHFEVVIISNKNVSEATRKIKHPDVSLKIIDNSNLSFGTKLNKFHETSKSDKFIFLTEGVKCRHNMLQVYLDALSAFNESDVSYSVASKEKTTNGYNLVTREILIKNPIDVLFMYSHNVIDKIGGYGNHADGVEKREYLLKIAECIKPVFIENNLGFYCDQFNQSTADKEACDLMIMDYVRSMREKLSIVSLYPSLEKIKGDYLSSQMSIKAQIDFALKLCRADTNIMRSFTPVFIDAVFKNPLKKFEALRVFFAYIVFCALSSQSEDIFSNAKKAFDIILSMDVAGSDLAMQYRKAIHNFILTEDPVSLFDNEALFNVDENRIFENDKIFRYNHG